MARIVIDVKERTKAKISYFAKKEGKTVKDFILWSVGLIALERGVEK